ncbi:FYDLN acid domain-containing protein [Hyphomicrobium sp.]|uniref:FYDLN acid domain-containing protein n=1 Tax=Hyphomicrobium sp. TaxID=82 RepID=UPI000FBCE1B2|nr:FYDLN acid domain-containing protein [Hyphomicrobium sp.]RUP11253.1 MAG: hypothetical protein EKK38_02035 [Hyphomicrobium sp.]
MLESHVVARSAVQAKRGTKQTCKNETCGSQYYDLKRVPPACPYCGASCDTPAIIRVDFETLEKQRPHKFKRWVEPTKSLAEVSKTDSDEVEAVEEEEAEKDSAIPSASEDLLIEIEDDDDEVQSPAETDSETT